MSLLVDVAIRSSLLVLAGLIAGAALRKRAAALRHAVLASSIGAAALVLPLTLLLPAWNVQVRVGVAQPAPAPRDVHPAAAAGVEVVEHARPGARPSAIQLVVGVWAAGFAMVGAMLATGLARLMWITARARRVADARWNRLADRVAAAYGVTGRVSLLHTDAQDVLATWGLFRPRLLLPSHADEWTDERAHAVLCHELAHVRRRDWLVQMVAEALRAIYWFNPLFWIACTRLRRDGEQACDDLVLATGLPAHDYAAHVLALARRCRRSAPALSCAMTMARSSTFERRMAAMLNSRLDHRTLSRSAMVCTAALFVAVALPTAAFRPTQGGPLPLSGLVYDASGAVVPDVALTLEDQQQHKWQATTDAEGRFELASVEPGRYVLEAKRAGFRSLRQSFDLRQTGDWDRAVTLDVGELQETVVVRERRLPNGASSSAKEGPTPIKVGGQIQAPRKLYNVPPTYPQAMREAGREGVVPMEAVIGRDGRVLTIRVVSAQVHPDFAVAAIDAVRQWRYDATLLNGVPVEVQMNVSVEFSLADD